MPWEVIDVMDQRKRFVLRALDPTACMSELCREFGITRKTGYKWLNRFRERGETGLNDLSRRPQNSPQRTSAELQLEIVKLRLGHPSWGPKKLRRLLRNEGRHHVPVESTIAKVLAEAGLVQRRRTRRSRVHPNSSQRVTPEGPNDLWTVDFKGWWRTRDGKRCEPLTIRDDWSRFILDIRAMKSTATEKARPVFEEAFSRYGLPAVIRSDNGSPFACTRSPSRLTKLSAWWVALGVQLDTIDPGSPQQNGGHERMHKDLAAEVERNPSRDAKTQQSLLDDWRFIFNTERPHEALGMKTPSQLYIPSTDTYNGLRPEIVYPENFAVRKVHRGGHIKFHGKCRFISEALASWPVGLEFHNDALKVWFTDICLGITNPKFSTPLLSPEA